jgi:hypothetical protein
MTTFETEEQSRRKLKAITLLTSVFDGSFSKLDPNDVSYKIFDKDKTLTAYAEICVRFKSIKDAYPLMMPVKKLIKLVDKRITPILIWSCDDGIIYGYADQLTGMIKWGSMTPNLASEMIVYYDKQKGLKYVRFV